MFGNNTATSGGFGSGGGGFGGSTNTGGAFGSNNSGGKSHPVSCGMQLQQRVGLASRQALQRDCPAMMDVSDATQFEALLRILHLYS